MKTDNTPESPQSSSLPSVNNSSSGGAHPNQPEPNRTNPNLSEPSSRSSNSSHFSLCTLHSSLNRHRRIGKVARLPLATREKVNTMLDDALPYAAIIRSLGPEGAHLNTDNIGNWVKGGYQDWLDMQEKHNFAEDFCHYIEKVDNPADPDALFEKTLRWNAFQICASLASLPRPNPDKPDYSWTRVTKDIPRLIKSFIDFRYCRDWTNPKAKADRLAREKQKNEYLLNAARLFSHTGADTLCEALHGTIKVNPDGTWHRPDQNLAPNLAPSAASPDQNLALSRDLALAPTEPTRANPNLPEVEPAPLSDPDSELVGTGRRSGPHSEVGACFSEPVPSLTSLASVKDSSYTSNEPNSTEPNRPSTEASAKVEGNPHISEAINYQSSTKSHVQVPNSESEAEKPQVASMPSKSKIANQNSKISEHCLECGHPLPALLLNRTRPAKRCDYCNFPLPTAGTCVEPSIEQCPLCRANLPRLLPNGQRPDNYCHNCTTSLL